MQDDPPAGRVHRLRDHAMALGILPSAHLRAVRRELARVVGRKSPGDKECRAAARTLGIERGEPPHAVGARLQARMHRAHDDPVTQAEKAEIERSEQVRVAHEDGDDTLPVSRGTLPEDWPE